MAFEWIQRSEYCYLAMEDDVVLTVRDNGAGWEYEIDMPGRKLISPASGKDEAMCKCLEAVYAERPASPGPLERAR